MKKFSWRALAVPALVAAGFLAGCGKGATVRIVYDRPPEYQIPSRVKKIAVAEFGGDMRREIKWGTIAADMLSSALDAYNKKFHRYVLVDRQRISAILAERDFQQAISDTDSAAAAGKIAKVDAMIYGTCHVVIKERTIYKTAIDPLSRSLRSKPVRAVYSSAAVNFTMDDIGSSKTLASVTVTKEWDSEKDKKSGGTKIGAVFGVSGGSKKAGEEIAQVLIEKCVEEFLQKISPHQVVEKIQLVACKSKVAKDANSAAGAEAYEDALEMFLAAADQVPGDHGALFNAGVMYEVLRKLDKAEEFYSKAIELKKDSLYYACRRRVRNILKGGTSPKPKNN